MTYKQTYKSFLEQSPKARERKYKNQATAVLLTRQFIELQDKPLDRLEEYVAYVLGLDRAWRGLLKDYPELRGSDYNDKDELEEKEMLNQGYDPLYHTDVKRLKEINEKD